MQTAQAFSAACPKRAAAIARNCDRDPHWLRRHRLMVESWAAELSLDISTEMASDLWEPSPPTSPIACDVIVPFCAADSRFLRQSLECLQSCTHATLHVHVIADACDFPDDCRELLRCGRSPDRATFCYRTPETWGPYRIANAIVAGGHLQTDLIALHDVDDVILPDRFWWQAITLQHFAADMISSAYQTFIDEDSRGDKQLQNRQRWEPICRPGVKYDSAPLGRTVNSSRMMTVELFHRLNGFADSMCSMDFDFDNRARLTGAVVIDDQTILGRRRLHSASLTGGPFEAKTLARKLSNDLLFANLEKVQADPTIATAFSCGSLDSSPTL
jgi:hypothetical protein